VRVVVDTNALVSGLLKPRSHPARILKLVLQGDVEIVVNEHILTEYQEVLARPKFQLNSEDVRQILDFFRSKAIVAPSLARRISLPDPYDEPFLEAALATGSDFLITGNTRHFPKIRSQGQKVLDPKGFLNTLF